MNEEFPSNSHSRREPPPQRRSEPARQEKQVRRVTRGKATLRKKSLRKRLAEAFTGDGNKGVFEYVLFDVLVPGIRDVAADVSTTAIERTLYGEDYYGGRRRRGGGGGGGYTSYSRMGPSRSRRDRDRDDDDRRPSRNDRSRRRRSDLPEVVVDSRAEAEEAIDQMFELISKYEAASVRDLLSMVGEVHTPTDEDWGWTDFRGARPVRVRDGYLIDCPRPEPLD